MRSVCRLRMHVQSRLVFSWYRLGTHAHSTCMHNMPTYVSVQISSLPRLPAAPLAPPRRATTTVALESSSADTNPILFYCFSLVLLLFVLFCVCLKIIFVLFIFKSLQYLHTFYATFLLHFLRRFCIECRCMPATVYFRNV